MTAAESHPNELTVQVGYRVSTEQQAVQTALLRVLVGELTGFVARVGMVDRAGTLLTPFQANPLPILRADAAIDEAQTSLLRAVNEARFAESTLTAATLAYAEAERRAHEMTRGLGGLLGYGLGLLGPIAVQWLLTPLLAAITGIGIGALRPGGAELLQAGAAAWWAEHRDILSEPLTVELVRAAIMGSDDALGGALHVPPALVLFLGDQGLGVTGVSTTTALLLALANGAGALREAPVTVTRTGTATGTVTAPTGLRDRLARVPHGVPHQVRVERYPVPGQDDRVEVFIGGTVDGSLFTGEQPWDMTSNVHGAAELQPASLRAVREALAEAGVSPGDRIAITGYSQGALVGALVAASGDYDVDFLLEVAGPSGQVAVPDSVTHVRLDHTADLVTALGGDVQGAHTVQVRRDGVPADTGQTGPGQALPAHDYTFYLQTAELADQSRHPEIRNAIEGANIPLRGAARGDASDWLAERQVSDARE